jgi:hypothetical protein
LTTYAQSFFVIVKHFLEYITVFSVETVQKMIKDEFGGEEDYEGTVEKLQDGS